MQRIHLFQLLVLSVIAFCLVVLVARPIVQPETVRAQTEASCGIFLEPGTTMIRTPANDRQVMGKIVINTCSGQIWGFPTTTSAPYPVDPTNPAPPVSNPIYLGKFAMEAVRK